jgi:hypothetical protein
LTKLIRVANTIRGHAIMDSRILDDRKIIALEHRFGLVICEISTEFKFALLDVKCDELCIEANGFLLAQSGTFLLRI